MIPGEKAGLESWTSGWTARQDHRCLDTQETCAHWGEGRLNLKYVPCLFVDESGLGGRSQL